MPGMTPTPAPTTVAPYAAESVSMADGWCTIDGTELPWEIHDVTIEPYDPTRPAHEWDLDWSYITVATLHMIARHVHIDASTGRWVIDGYPIPWFIAAPSEFPPGIDLTAHGYLRLSIPLLLFADWDTPRPPIVCDPTDRDGEPA